MKFPGSISIPPEVVEIATKLEGAGFETWCVGGAVRDALLGLTGKDFDLATSATPKEVRKLFRRTVPVGIEHGTVAVLDRLNQPHEVTTFRKDILTDGRHAKVAFGVSLDEDLARRDFTINAIAYHPLRGEWRDLFDGQKDLEAKLIRAVGNPETRFREDLLRILRALRFSARFQFDIDGETWSAAVSCITGLQRLSAERVRDEWMRGLSGAFSVCEFIKNWHDVGALKIWLPELLQENEIAGLPLLKEAECQHESSQDTGDAKSGYPVLVTSYLSSDPVKTLGRLKCSRAEIERGGRMHRFRERWPDDESETSTRRWMAEVGSSVDDLIWLWQLSERPFDLEATVRRIRESGAPLTIGDLAISGNDLLSAGVEEGPKMGRVLGMLLELVLEEPEKNTRATLLNWTQDYLAKNPSGREIAGSDG